jgi:hypothetical protein
MQSRSVILPVLLAALSSPCAFGAQPLRPGEVIAIKPQPEAPGAPKQKNLKSPENVGINPQPEPPLPVDHKLLRPKTAIGINPQPEPPVPQRR